MSFAWIATRMGAFTSSRRSTGVPKEKEIPVYQKPPLIRILAQILRTFVLAGPLPDEMGTFLANKVRQRRHPRSYVVARNLT